MKLSSARGSRGEGITNSLFCLELKIGISGDQLKDILLGEMIALLDFCCQLVVNLLSGSNLSNFLAFSSFSFFSMVDNITSM